MTIKSLSTAAGKVASVQLLGKATKLDWQQTANALVINPVAHWPCSHAVAFKIELAK